MRRFRETLGIIISDGFNYPGFSLRDGDQRGVLKVIVNPIVTRELYFLSSFNHSSLEGSIVVVLVFALRYSPVYRTSLSLESPNGHIRFDTNSL